MLGVVELAVNNALGNAERLVRVTDAKRLFLRSLQGSKLSRSICDWGRKDVQHGRPKGT